jgi:hypothetical protein
MTAKAVPQALGGVHAVQKRPDVRECVCRNEDFYAAIDAGTVPAHDVLLTNAPYSGDHIDRLLAFCQAHTKPWLLLMPSYVHQKAYFANMFEGATHRPVFAVPKKRYYYWTPKGAARENPKVRKDGRCSPFVTLWCAFSSPLCAISCMLMSMNTRH